MFTHATQLQTSFTLEPSPGCKVQGTLIVIVLEVDTGPKSDEVLQTADVALATCIVQWGTPCLVLLIEELQQTDFRLYLQCSQTIDQKQSGKIYI